MTLKTIVCLSLITLASLSGLTAHAQTYSVIHTFSGTGGDGAIPQAGVTLRAGSLYGTTQKGGSGGANGPGTVYEMTRTGSNWAYSPIFLFPADKSGGAGAVARVVFLVRMAILTERHIQAALPTPVLSSTSYRPCRFAKRFSAPGKRTCFGISGVARTALIPGTET